MLNHYSFAKKKRSVFYTIMVLLLYMAYSSNTGCTEHISTSRTRQINDTITNKNNLPNLQKKSSSTQSLENKNSTEEISNPPLPDLVSGLDINKRKRTNSDGGTNKIPSEKVKESLESDEYPLHTAILKKDYTTVKKLLKNQAVLNEKDKDGNTPLHIAVKHNQLNTVQLLLDKKADPLYENDKNQTPLDLAVIHDRCDIVIHLTQVIKNKSKQLGADLKTIRTFAKY